MTYSFAKHWFRPGGAVKKETIRITVLKEPPMALILKTRCIAWQVGFLSGLALCAALLWSTSPASVRSWFSGAATVGRSNALRSSHQSLRITIRLLAKRSPATE